MRDGLGNHTEKFLSRDQNLPRRRTLLLQRARRLHTATIGRQEVTRIYEGASGT